MAIAQEAQTGDQFAALETRLADIEERYELRIAELEARMPDDRVTIVCFSGDLDKAMAAFIIATGALAMGYECSMYFTFWGLSVIKE